MPVNLSDWRGRLGGVVKLSYLEGSTAVSLMDAQQEQWTLTCTRPSQ